MPEEEVKKGYLFSEIYDSIYQAARFDMCNEPLFQLGSNAPTSILPSDALFDGYFGRLRFDATISKNVVITDAQFFDGKFFINAALRGRLQELPLSRLTIRSRSKRPLESFLGFLVSANSDRLKHFEFSSLPLDEDARNSVKDLLPNTPAREINSVRDVSRLLRSAGVREDWVEALETAWSRLIEAVEKPKRGHADGLKFEPWEQILWFERLKTRLSETMPKYARALDEEGNAILRCTWEKKNQQRSEIARYLQSLRAEAARKEDFDLLINVNSVETWYNHAYNETAKDQHSCEMLDRVDLPGACAADEFQQTFDGNYDRLYWSDKKRYEDRAEFLEKRRDIQIPESFLQTLGRVEQGQFLFFLEKNRSFLEEWIETNKSASLEKAISDLLDITESSGGLRLQSNNIIESLLGGRLKVIVVTVGTWGGHYVWDLVNLFTGGDIWSDLGNRQLAELLGAVFGGLAAGEVCRTIGERADPRCKLTREIVKRGKRLRGND